MLSTQQSFSDYFLAEVKNVYPDRRLDVYIPRLMSAIPNANKDIKISNVGIKTNLKYNKDLKESQTITARPFYFNSDVPSVGSKVMIIFLDLNPGCPLWMEYGANKHQFTLNKEYQTKMLSFSKMTNIDSEMLSKLPIDNEYTPHNATELFNNENVIVDGGDSINVDIARANGNVVLKMKVNPKSLSGLYLTDKIELT